ncbi:lysylphosphatidylglycerol synthase transmembrane domain-containing protein [Kosakonia oryzendophytica]|uniref:lysylphosphatidylglycerol synthase transmembrane domain-containing protein n=1 Tax=Kosakonia oryzendophytica TaxID=1005665 RepID=UPI003D33653A
MIAVLYFLVAVFFLILGHSIRVKRWNNLLPGRDDTARSIQFTSLSLGYVVNFFVPLRLGEIVRAGVFSYLGRQSFALSFASVFFERVFDLLVWGAILIWFNSASNLKFNLTESLVVLVSVFLFFALCSLIGSNKNVKKALNSLTGIFNDEISYSLRHFFWCLNEVYICFRKNLLSYIVNSALMWAAYLASYHLIARCTGASASMLIYSLFDTPLSSTFNALQDVYSAQVFTVLTLFFLSPVLFIFAYYLIKNKYSFEPGKVLRWFEFNNDTVPNKRDLFYTEEQYKMFLVRNFRNDVDLISEFYKKGMGNDVILYRIFHGGSDALTALISFNNSMYVRKFASELGSGKLQAQKKWLCEYANELVLASVASDKKLDNGYIYDMPYSHTSIDFYEFIHSSSLDTSWGYLAEVLNSIKDFHARKNTGLADDSMIESYISAKMAGNFNNIKGLSSIFFDKSQVVINGRNIDLDAISDWINDSARNHDFKFRETSVIHGDLTIENIIIDKKHENGWFIIDPNIGNFFESPLLDYAKLMQSLHLGYESLNRSINCHVENDEITVSIFRSSQYAAIYEKYKQWIVENFGQDFLKEVMLHEIIHYTRLVPYKFRKDKATGNAFTACMLLLIDEYLELENTL